MEMFTGTRQLLWAWQLALTSQNSAALLNPCAIQGSCIPRCMLITLVFKMLLATSANESCRLSTDLFLLGFSAAAEGFSPAWPNRRCSQDTPCDFAAWPCSPGEQN